MSNLSETFCPKEEVHALRIEKNEQDIHGIGIRTTENERNIIQLEKGMALSEQRFQTLLTQLSEVPQTMNDMKKTMLEMQNETKILIMSIQNENSNTKYEVNNIKSEISDLKNDMKRMKEKNEVNEEKSKFDFIVFIKEKALPVIFGGGVVWAILEIINSAGK